MTEIPFRQCPTLICNYYDKGPSARRVLRAQSRLISKRNPAKGVEYVVIHSYGRDYWRQDKWGDWKIHKSSEGG